MQTSPLGIVAIALHEGLVPAPYVDSVGVWTFGVGHTAAAGGLDPRSMPKAYPEDGDLSDAIALAISTFADDLKKYEDRVNKAVHVELEQHEFDALVSFDVNTGGIFKAKLTQSLNAGDKEAAARQFMGWLRPSEIRSRRTAEMNLFRSGKYPTGDIPVWRTNGAGKLLRPKSDITGGELVQMLDAVNAPDPDDMLRFGDNGDLVLTLQGVLADAGFNPGPIDGDYGLKTKAAVAAMQDALGRPITGRVSNELWEAITLSVEEDVLEADPQQTVSIPGPDEDVIILDENVKVIPGRNDKDAAVLEILDQVKELIELAQKTLKGEE